MLLERSAAFNSQPDAFPELLDKLHRTFFAHTQIFLWERNIDFYQ